MNDIRRTQGGMGPSVHLLGEMFKLEGSSKAWSDWDSFPSMLTPRRGLSASVLKDGQTIVALGGWDGTKHTASVRPRIERVQPGTLRSCAPWVLCLERMEDF